jgi:hypothetical protein
MFKNDSEAQQTVAFAMRRLSTKNWRKLALDRA